MLDLFSVSKGPGRLTGLTCGRFRLLKGRRPYENINFYILCVHIISLINPDGLMIRHRRKEKYNFYKDKVFIFRFRIFIPRFNFLEKLQYLRTF